MTTASNTTPTGDISTPSHASVASTAAQTAEFGVKSTNPFMSGCGSDHVPGNQGRPVGHLASVESESRKGTPTASEDGSNRFPPLEPDVQGENKVKAVPDNDLAMMRDAAGLMEDPDITGKEDTGERGPNDKDVDTSRSLLSSAFSDAWNYGSKAWHRATDGLQSDCYSVCTNYPRATTALTVAGGVAGALLAYYYLRSGASASQLDEVLLEKLGTHLDDLPKGTTPVSTFASDFYGKLSSLVSKVADNAPDASDIGKTADSAYNEGPDRAASASRASKGVLASAYGATTDGLGSVYKATKGGLTSAYVKGGLALSGMFRLAATEGEKFSEAADGLAEAAKTHENGGT